MNTTARMLHAPSAFPTRLWLRDQLLWADTIGAIWPTGEFPKLTPEQEASAEEITFIQEQAPEVFEAVHLEEGDLDSASRQVLQRSRRTTRKQTSPQQAAVERLYASSPSDAPSEWLTENDAESYVHNEKFPPKILNRLTTAGVLNPTENGLGYTCDEPGLVSQFIAAGATSAAERLQWSVAVDSAKSAYDMLPPAATRTKHTAAVYNLPSLPAAREDISIEQLLDTRAKDSFVEQRRSYLDHLDLVRRETEARVGAFNNCESWQEVQAALNAEQEFDRAVMAEFRRANQAWWKRLDKANLISAAVASAFTVVSAVNLRYDFSLSNVTAVGADVSETALHLVSSYHIVHPFVRSCRSVIAAPA